MQARNESPTTTKDIQQRLDQDIVLWLDLADANHVEDVAIQERLPKTAQVLRLSEYHARQYPLGTPDSWRPVLDAIDSLVRRARRLEKESARCRYWVTGRAGLPAFLHVGHRLSKFAAITFVHQAMNGREAEVVQLDAAGSVHSESYFERTPIPPSDSTWPVALVVSSRDCPAGQQIETALADRRTRPAAVIHVHSPADLSAKNIGSAVRDLERALRDACIAHSARSTLGVFIRGPAMLAFLVGRAINPRVCRDVQIFEFDGSRYSLAYELPYPPIPERNTVLLLLSSPQDASKLALDEEIRSLRLEQCDDTVADRLDIVDVPAAQAKDVPLLLRKRQPGVMHFSGHGENGELLFQAGDGSARPVSTVDLVEILRLAGGSVRLVVLNACHSESHAVALLAHADCVVAMRGPIWDTDAIRFTTAFYRHLAEGDSVQDTFDKALQAMRLARSAGLADSRVQEFGLASTGANEDPEPPRLRERDPGCARELFLVRRRR